VARTPSDATSTFENRYTPDGRQQWLHAAASPLRVADLPATWRACPLVHLGPLLQECPTELLDVFPNAKIIVTPQGWMRYWDPLLPAQVFTRIWQPAPELLRRLSGVVLSIEDVRGDEQVAIDYARHCPLVALTRGNRGSTLFVDGVPHAIPARPAREVDPTGAGDVFAAALLIRLHETGDPVAAAHFAAQVAGAAVEGLGTSAIPTREQL
jgi:sugar/nucleoside kinase (ribokinase family)